MSEIDYSAIATYLQEKGFEIDGDVYFNVEVSGAYLKEFLTQMIDGDITYIGDGTHSMSIKQPTLDRLRGFEVNNNGIECKVTPSMIPLLKKDPDYRSRESNIKIYTKEPHFEVSGKIDSNVIDYLRSFGIKKQSRGYSNRGPPEKEPSVMYSEIQYPY